MKLLRHELTRLHKHAELTLRLSIEKKTDVTKKEITEFSQDLLNTIQRKRQVKHWLLVLVEGE